MQVNLAMPTILSLDLIDFVDLNVSGPGQSRRKRDFRASTRHFS